MTIDHAISAEGDIDFDSLLERIGPFKPADAPHAWQLDLANPHVLIDANYRAPFPTQPGIFGPLSNATVRFTLSERLVMDIRDETFYDRHTHIFKAMLNAPGVGRIVLEGEYFPALYWDTQQLWRITNFYGHVDELKERIDRAGLIYREATWNDKTKTLSPL